MKKRRVEQWSHGGQVDYNHTQTGGEKDRGRENTEQTHPTLIQNKPGSHVIALSLEDVKEQGDAVLCGGDQLPDAVLVGRVLSGPPGAGDGPVELGDEASAGGCTVRTRPGWRRTQVIRQ